MSYQALARKYRPSLFNEVNGQEHALNSLIHALDTKKIHHAYLFTGTRGVGKTTLARLLAKCLNCQKGITSQPCNKCDSCVSINNGTFIDLIEIDAASRTSVEETKEILDNVKYMPSQGKYKVYLIDEVHMLSKQSFNALLKTLEEPPEYVKFILATTEHHKIPVTILSRCIQLHLKHISQKNIKQQLIDILEKENIPFEDSALEYIAYFAKGSMRDALSLLDQAISFCNNNINENSIKEMLGIIDNQEINNLVRCIINNDANNIIPAIQNLSLNNNSAEEILNKISQIWFSCCSFYFTKSLELSTGINKQIIDEVLQKISIEEAHLLYQLTISAKKDIHLAPDLQTGLAMTILRLIAFQKKNLTKKQKTPIVNDIERNSEQIKQDINLTPRKNISHKNNCKTNSSSLLNIVKSVQQSESQFQKRDVEKQKIVPEVLKIIKKEELKPIINISKDNIINIKSNFEAKTLEKKWISILDKLNLKGLVKSFAINTSLINIEDNKYILQINSASNNILKLDNNITFKLQQELSIIIPNIEIIISKNIQQNLKTPFEIKKETAINKVLNSENINILKDELYLKLDIKNILIK